MSHEHGYLQGGVLATTPRRRQPVALFLDSILCFFCCSHDRNLPRPIQYDYAPVVMKNEAKVRVCLAFPCHFLFFSSSDPRVGDRWPPQRRTLHRERNFHEPRTPVSTSHRPSGTTLTAVAFVYQGSLRGMKHYPLRDGN